MALPPCLFKTRLSIDCSVEDGKCNLLRVFDDYLFRLEFFVIRFDEGIKPSGLSLLYSDDHIRLIGEAGMIEIIARRFCRMIRVRVIIADDLKTVFVCVSICAFVLVCGYPVAIRMRFAICRGGVMLIGCWHGFPEGFRLTDRSIPLVVRRINFAQNIDAVFERAEQKAAALVRISLLAVPVDLSDLFFIDLDCQWIFPPKRRSSQ